MVFALTLALHAGGSVPPCDVPRSPTPTVPAFQPVYLGVANPRRRWF